jgi:NAD(P)-dependent dehydrogenase (short-subunit alcohol dehydrogenase family)
MSSQRFSLEGKTAIVTGASRGIGAAIAKGLLEHGAQVVLSSRKIEPMEGDNVLSVPCHTGQPQQIDALVARTVERFGKVDVLINNAATNPYFGPMLGIDWGAWDKTFEVNVKGYFHAARAVAQHLLDRKAPGSIVNVSSIVGTTAAPLQGVYAMTKAAVISMTKTMAVELGHAKIRVNAIQPGFIDTRFAAALVGSDPINKTIVARTPLGRIGEPEDIVGLAIYLASDASSFVTGASFLADGGLDLGGMSIG